MTYLAKCLRFLPRSRRTAGLSIVCLPLLVAGWFQFGSEDTEAEPVPPRRTAAVAKSRASSRVASSHYEVEAGQTGNIVRASATESYATTDGALNAPGEPEDPDAALRSAIAGEWEDDYQGKRHLTVANDGTGTMVVELDGIGKKLIAPRLSFDLEWGLAEGYVSMKTLGGEPKSKVQVVLKLYGSEANYRILELTADRMLLLDADGKTRYDWRRPNSAKPGGTPATSSQ
jgi:hypothetical protein